jgi:3-oxoacyl-[acyl-carrier-protein] synthase-3
MKNAHIVGWGKYVPKRVMTNHELAKTVDTSDQWIREMTGIAARHIANERETCSMMATAAALQALDIAGVAPNQIDLVIVATCTADYKFPSTASLVQDAIGANNAGAFDLQAACAGFVYGMSAGADAIRSGNAKNVLLIGAEKLSSVVNWKDRNTCVLFGDGAGAIVLQSSEQPGGVLSSMLRSDGSGADFLMIPAGGSAKTITNEAVAAGEQYIRMNGREVFKFATRVVDKSVREVIKKSGWTTSQVDLVVPHQANIRIIESAAKALGVSMNKFFVNIEKYGNTSAASIPIALTEAVEKKRLREKDRIVLVGFGAGLAYAATAVEWGAPRKVGRAKHTINRVGYGIAGIRSRLRRASQGIEDRLLGTTDPAVKHPEPKKIEKNGQNGHKTNGHKTEEIAGRKIADRE